MYNAADGQLLHDPAGTGSAHAVLFATVTAGTSLTVGDLLVV